MSFAMSYFPKKSNRSMQVAIIFAVLLCLWMFSGLFVKRDFEAENAAVPPKKQQNVTEAVKYEVAEFKAQNKRRTSEVQGETKAVRDVSLVAEINGKVVGLLAQEGQAVKAGQPLVQLDLQDRKERLESLQAVVEQQKLQYQVAQGLSKRGFESKVSLLRAKAELAQAQASLKQIKLQLDFATIKAPFDGFLEKINVKEGDFLDIGKMTAQGAVARVVDINPILVQGAIAQDDRLFVAEDQIVEIALQNGAKYQGKIHYLAHSADKSTRAFPIEISVKNANYEILSGLSASIYIPLNEVKAHFIPSSSLSLRDDGAVQVKEISDDGKVEVHSVKIIGEEDNGIWVEGLPQIVRIITKGQAYASAGEVIAENKIRQTQ
jgi:multidrug efflux system membrane fusion protein